MKMTSFDYDHVANLSVIIKCLGCPPPDQIIISHPKNSLVVGWNKNETAVKMKLKRFKIAASEASTASIASNT
jgi:hypothetical protein